MLPITEKLSSAVAVEKKNESGKLGIEIGLIHAI